MSLDRDLLYHLTTPEGMKAAVEATLDPAVIEDLDCRVGVHFALRYFDEYGKAPTLEVLKRNCSPSTKVEVADREADPRCLVDELVHRHRVNQVQRLMLAAAETSVADPEASLAKLIVDATAVLKTAGADAGSLLDRISHDGAWLDAQEFTSLEYAVDGIIPEGMGLLVAPPKKGKSWFVGNIGLAVAAGGLALGAIRVEQRPVLYLALEDGYKRLQNRFRRMLANGPIPEGITTVTRATPAEAMAVITEFMARHASDKPLVILDTLGKVKRHKKPGEDAYLVDYEVGATLKKLSDAVPGSTLLVVHHTRKAESADFVDSVSGTQGIAGSVDFVLVLARKRHENNAILSVTGRDVIEAEYALHADDGILWRLDGDDLTSARDTVDSRRAADTLGDRMMEVYLVVRSADTPISAVGVAGKCQDMDNDVAGQYLRRLCASGYITRVKRGFYTVSEVSELSERLRERVKAQVSDTRSEDAIRTDPGESVYEVSESGPVVSHSDTSDTSYIPVNSDTSFIHSHTSTEKEQS